MQYAIIFSALNSPLAQRDCKCLRHALSSPLGILRVELLGELLGVCLLRVCIKVRLLQVISAYIAKEGVQPAAWKQIRKAR